MQSLLEKLMLAGWVEKTSITDRPGGAQVGGIVWTPFGQQRIGLFCLLIHEIESKAGPLTNEEIPFLKALSQIANIQLPPKPPDEPGIPPRR